MKNYLGVVCILLASCSLTPSDTAETIIWNGTIYTADAEQNVVEAIAIKGDTLVYVGDQEGARAWLGPDTAVVDLQGKMALPGLHDVHVHPVLALEKMTCNLPARNEFKLPQVVNALTSCLEALGDKAPQPGGWITVSQFNGYGADSADFMGDYSSIRAGLDQISKRHSIFLSGADGHVYGVNSYALQHGATLKGKQTAVNATTLAGELAAYREYFQLDSAGQPTGLVKDAGAYDLFNYDKESVASLIERADDVNNYFLSAGITSAQEAWASPRDIAVFQGMSEQGLLQVNMNMALTITRDRHLDAAGRVKIDELLSEFRQVRSELAALPRLRADGVKIMLDGVIEYPTQTAAMKHHYLHADWQADGATHYSVTAADCPAAKAPCEGERFNYGILELQEDDLANTVSALDTAGFTVHFHALGDRAVTTSLDALEKTRAANPGSDLPHNIAHFQQVDPNDIPRFGALKVFITPTMSWVAPWLDYDKSVIPYMEQHANVNDLDDLYAQDTRYMRRLYPIHSIMSGGATVSAGSDAPVDGPLPRPFTDIMSGLMRGGWVSGPGTTDAAPTWVVLNRDERIAIEDLLDAYTINGARALQQSTTHGSLEVGKRADVVIINQDIIAAAHTLGESGPERDFSEAAHTICDYWYADHCRTRVVATYLDGKKVYSDSVSP